MRRIQTELPGWIQKSGRQAEAMPLVQKVLALAKDKKAPITEDGENRPGELSLAARNALLAMIDELEERGFRRPQAYALCSVAVDLKVSQVVDVPNVLVSAFLPLDIFG